MKKIALLILWTSCTVPNPLYVGTEEVPDGIVLDDASLTWETDSLAVGDMVTFADMSVLPDMMASPDLVELPDLVDLPDLLPNCSISAVRAGCRQHLQAGCLKDGAYTVQVKGLGEMQVWCEMQDDGGGWALAYSNANNWASEGASDIASIIVNGNRVAKWYDSKWRLRDPSDLKRLGKAWNGMDPLSPEVVGSNDLKRFYDGGFTEVRFEFVQGSDGATSSGWCATEGTWDWSATNKNTFRCKDKNAGSGHMICLSGGAPCDGHDGNVGWINNIALGNNNSDYANQSAPNHLHLGPGCGGVGFPCTVGAFVALWNQIIIFGKDYQIRIWLRTP